MGSTRHSLSGTKRPEALQLDGCDLAPLLRKDPTNPTLVTKSCGKVRDTMVWHFPNSAALESSIRVGDYKLVRNYDHINNPNNEPLELYRLYNSKAGCPSCSSNQKSSMHRTLPPTEWQNP